VSNAEAFKLYKFIHTALVLNISTSYYLLINIICDISDTVIAEATLAHQAGITILSVGVGSGVNLYEIKMASSHPHLQYHQWWTAADFGNSFSVLQDGVEAEICNPQYGTVPLKYQLVHSTLYAINHNNRCNRFLRQYLTNNLVCRELLNILSLQAVNVFLFT